MTATSARIWCYKFGIREEMALFPDPLDTLLRLQQAWMHFGPAVGWSAISSGGGGTTSHSITSSEPCYPSSFPTYRRAARASLSASEERDQEMSGGPAGQYRLVVMPSTRPSKVTVIPSRVTGATAKLNGIEPMAWLAEVLERVVSGGTKAHELHTLLPWNWTPTEIPTKAALPA
jgi:hypothetical protein